MKTLLVVCLLFSIRAYAAEDYPTLFSGQYLHMKGTRCAGIIFESKEKAFLVADMDCRPDLEVRVRWIRPDVFDLIEVERITENCPPRNWIYEITKFDNNIVNIHEYWTGWGKLKDTETQYTLEKYDPEE